MQKYFLDKIFLTNILIIFSFITFQGLLSVIFSVAFGEYAIFLKAWKEILILINIFILLLLLKKWQIIPKIKQNKIIIFSLAFIFVHLIYACIDLLSSAHYKQNAAGLLIDLRFISFFMVTYFAILIYPKMVSKISKTILITASIVVLFGLIQFILPADFLKNFGYSDSTIKPYQTIDTSHNFIRLQSTFRGPNPFSAYSMIISSLIFSYLLFYYSAKRHKFNWQNKRHNILIILFFASIITTFFSYSRAALVALAVSFLIIIFYNFRKFLSKDFVIKMLIILSVITINISYLAKDTTIFQNVIMHKNPQNPQTATSNYLHLESLEKGGQDLIKKPMGKGIGSSGSASLFNDNQNKIIENQYLFILHEVGIIGLSIFLVIYYLIMANLYQNRQNWFNFGLFASGVGCFLIGILLPVWADDTVALIWWGLAGVAIGYNYHQKKEKQ